MSVTTIYVPDIGSDGEVEVIELLVSKGDTLAIDDPIIAVESDKASIEVPATQAGVVTDFVVKVGDKVKQGDALLTISSNGETKATEQVDKPTDIVQAQGRVDEVQSKDVGTVKGPSTVAVLTTVEVVVPDLGGAQDVEVIELSATAGAKLNVDDALVVIETDKASMDIPTTVSGELIEIKVALGDKVNEGDVLALVSTDSTTSAMPTTEQEEASQGSLSNKGTHESGSNTQGVVSASDQATRPVIMDDADLSAPNIHAGPAVRKLARELGVQLDRVKASGPKGRIQKDDLNAYIKNQVQVAQSGGPSAGPIAPKLPDFSQFGEIETRKLEKLHLLTARNMQSSWSNIPHVTQFDEADITELERFRKAKKEQAAKKQVKLTPLPFLIAACAHALKALPQFNVSLDLEKEQLVQKRYFNIGIAVDTSYGLVVPVVKDVLQKDLWQIAGELGELADKAKARKLAPADMQGACFTISSLGSIGGTAFTPIVNQPEVAILGVSKAQMKPIYNNGDFHPRLMLPLSLSYDHRAVNGADAARFTSLIAKYLSDIRELLF